MPGLDQQGASSTAPAAGAVARRRGLKIYYPIHCTGDWGSHVPISFARVFHDHGLDLELWVPSAAGDGRCPYVREGGPGPVHKLLYRLGGGWLTHLTERRYLASLRPGDVGYAWCSAGLRLMRRIKDRGHTLVVERINCHEATSKLILDEAYRRLGFPANPTITDESVREAREIAALADRLFTANPLSTRALLDDGVPPERIFESSYGWDPDRFRGGHRALPPCDGLTVLFVGTICVRKGAHLLLDAWVRSGVRGRLVLVGDPMEPLIAERYADFLNRPDVLHRGWTRDVGAYYRSADVFAFPTLEEGGPMVNYEAMGCGVPTVVSPMGAGAVPKDSQDLIVLDPYDVDAWAEAFRHLAADEAYRRELGERGRRRAEEFTWENVGIRRLGQLEDLIRSLGFDCGNTGRAAVPRDTK